jgi:O-antigen/teichoic acid export membrane protein
MTIENRMSGEEMSRKKELAKNTIIIAIGKICTQFISFFLLPIYTTLLSTEEYGIVDLFNTYIMLLIPLITFQVEQALFRFLVDVRNDDDEKKTLVSTVLIFAVIQCTIYFILFLAMQNFIHNEYKYFLVTNVITYIFSDTMLQLARGLGDNSTYAIGSFITAITTILFNILFIIVFRLGAAGMFEAIFLANLVCILFIFFKKRVYSYISFKRIKITKLKELLRYSLPLVPNSLSWWVLNASDRTVVSSFLGVAANGILSVSHKFSSIYITFYNIFNLTWIESATLHIHDEDREEFFSDTISTVFRLFSAVCLGVIACMPFVFPFLINEKFGIAYYQIPIYMLASLFNIVLALYSVVYVAMKLTREMAKTAIFAGIINIIAIIFMIRVIGLYAASISSVLSYGAMMIYRYFDIKKYINIKFSKRLMLSTLVMLVFLFITYYRTNVMLHVIALLITIVYATFVNRVFLKDIIIMLRELLHKHH